MENKAKLFLVKWRGPCEVTAAASQGVPLRFLGPRDSGMLQGFFEAMLTSSFNLGNLNWIGTIWGCSFSCRCNGWVAMNIYVRLCK